MLAVHHRRPGAIQRKPQSRQVVQAAHAWELLMHDATPIAAPCWGVANHDNKLHRTLTLNNFIQMCLQPSQKLCPTCVVLSTAIAAVEAAPAAAHAAHKSEQPAVMRPAAVLTPAPAAQQ